MMIALMEGNKALGPNGFPILFYKKYWEVIKNDLMQVFKDSHERDFLDKGRNGTFLSLIPKKIGVEQILEL